MLLTTENLGKRYGRKNALKGVNLHVPEGAIYGLIGQNGAGKTTLMKIINGQIRQTEGHLRYGETGAVSNPVRIGALVESPALYPDDTALENLLHKCCTAGVRSPRVEASSLLRLVGLSDTGKKKTKQFSLGMKQRLGIALSLVGHPNFLLLDEPINGMDPQGIAEIREMLIRLNREEGITVLISSHILEELGKFATHYGMIRNGQLLVETDREALEHQDAASIWIKSPHMDRIALLLAEKFGISANVQQGAIHIRDTKDQNLQISRAIFDAGIYMEEYRVDHASLEAYFISLMEGEEHGSSH